MDGSRGRRDTLTLDINLVLVSADPSDSENAPDFRVIAGEGDDAREVGAGWKHTGESAGPFISVLLDDPVFAQPIRARLFQSDEDGRDWNLRWTRQKKRDEQE